MSTSDARRTVWLLSGSLALGMSGLSIFIASAPVVGNSLAEDKSLSTLPSALMAIGLMAATVPASLFMKKVGRRPGFLTGVLVAAIAATCLSLAVTQASFWLLCLGAALLGASNSFVQYYRFAAADVAPPDYKSTAISLVMAGGVVSALLGPNLAAWGREAVPTIPFLGTFLSMFALQVPMIVALSMLRIPEGAAAAPPPGTAGAAADLPARPLREIARQPAFIMAVVAGMLGYGIMTMTMTATPLAILDCGYTFSDSAFIIQWHVLGMYVPSFFTGRLIKRFGVTTIIAAGAVCYLVTVLAGLTGLDLYLNFWVALVLLGVGWNFMFIGGTALLTDTYRPSERNKVQACNDFIVFSCMAASSLAAGVLHTLAGWNGVIIAVIPMTLVVGATLLWFAAARKRMAAA